MIFFRPIELEVHGCEFSLIGAEGGQNYRLLNGKERTVTAVFWDFQDNCDVGSVKGKTFFDCLSNRVPVGGIVVTESPDL